jgi:hypothetical protein
MNTTIESQIISLIQETAKQQAEREEERAKQQAEREEERAKQQAEVNALIIGELKIVKTELAEIKSTVLIIKGFVISDFENVSQGQKAAIEAAAEEINDTAAIDFVKNPQFTRKVTRNASGQLIEKKVRVDVYSTAKYFNLNDIAGRGLRSAAGNWVSGILTKIFGVKFNGNYPPYFETLINCLLDYYFYERISERAY